MKAIFLPYFCYIKSFYDKASQVNQHMLYADILLPIHFSEKYTYKIPTNMAVETYARVLIPFGKRDKLHTGIVLELHDREPIVEAKSIMQVIDTRAFIHDNELRFWRWCADYYLCSLGDIMTTAVPTSMRWEGEVYIRLVEQADKRVHDPNKLQLLSPLMQKKSMNSVKSMKYRDYLKKFTKTGARRLIHDMIKSGVLCLKKGSKKEEVLRLLISTDKTYRGQRRSRRRSKSSF